MAEGFKLLDAYVEVKASGHGLAEKVAGDIERESTGSRGLGRTGSSMGSNLLGGLKGAFTSGAVGGLVGGVVGSVTSGLTSLIGSAVSDIGGMLTTVGGEIASTVIDFNSQLQNATIGFETMLGSGVKAKSFLGDLQNFAKATPFEFKGLVSNAQLLMGMGVAAHDVIPTLTALGDSVAAMGGSAQQVDQVTLAFGQMVSKGTLDMGNMTQVLQGGVPSALKVLAASYHVTTGRMIEMISAGDVQSKDALPRLVKGIERGTKSTAALGGMMDKQSQTFTGALSNIQDAFQQTTAKAFKPFFDVASNGLQHFATALTGKPAEKFTKDVTKAIKPLAKELDKWFKSVDINKVFKDGSKAVKDFFRDFKPKDFVKSLKDFVKAGGDIATEVLPLFPKMMKLIHDWLPVAVKVTKWAVDTGKAFKHGADQWNDAFTVLGVGMDVTSKKFNHGADQWGDASKKAVHDWKHGADQLNSFFNDVGGFFTDLVGKFSHGWDQIGGFVSSGVGKFKHGADQIVGFFTGLPGALATIGGQMVDGLVGGLRNGWHQITDTLHTLAMALPEPVRKALDIHSPSRVFHLIGQQVSQGLHKGLLGSVDQIKEASGKLADAVMGDKRFHGTALGSKMVDAIRKDAKDLERLSTRRDKAGTKLADAQSHLKDVLASRKDFAANVKSGVMGSAGVADLFMAQPAVIAAQAGTLNGQAYTPSWTTTGRTGLTAVKASLKTLLADTKKFSANMAKLVKAGIDPATYDELVQAGVRGGGLETSNALLSDPAMARSIFSLEKDIGKAGGSLGTKTAGHEYAGQVSRARSAVRTDQRAVTHINVQMVVEAKKIDEVQKLVDMVHHVKQTARKGKRK